MFITLESTEGAGKGTLAPLMKKAIELSGRGCVHVRQPGGTVIGEMIREIYLWHGSGFTPEEEILLLAVDRKRTWEEIIRPALDLGKVVICERWNASTFAYNVGGRSINNPVRQNMLGEYMQTHFRTLGLLDKRPDVSIYLDMQASVGLNRINVRKNLDRMEKEGVVFMDYVNHILQQVHAEKTRWLMDDSRVVNAQQPLDKVKYDILKVLSNLGLFHKELVKLILEEEVVT